jgi:uncharacterized membrane protein
MDFGLSRFLEMFEERFGRRLTTALLAIIALAIFGVCAKLIYEDILTPLYAFAIRLFSINVALSITPTIWLAAAASGGAVLVLAAVFHIFVRYQTGKFLKKVIESQKIIHGRMVKATDDLNAMTNKIRAGRAERRPIPEQPSTPEKT